MGGNNHSKVHKVEQYLERNDEKSLMHFLQTHRIPTDFIIKYSRRNTAQANFEEDMYILHYATRFCYTQLFTLQQL